MEKNLWIIWELLRKTFFKIKKIAGRTWYSKILKKIWYTNLISMKIYELFQNFWNRRSDKKNLNIRDFFCKSIKI